MSANDPFTMRAPTHETLAVDDAVRGLADLKVCRGCGALRDQPCREGAPEHSRRMGTSILVIVTTGRQASRTSLYREACRGLIESGQLESIAMEAAATGKHMHEVISARLG